MCSKKVAGVALFTAGLILVILGVVFGLLLPSAAQKKIEESVCVNSKDSPGYGRWVSVLCILLMFISKRLGRRGTRNSD